MLSAPASTAGSRPTILASALWLSSVAKSLSPKPTEVDIVEFLVNPFKCNICAFTPLVSATEITEALAMAAQAKITDSNSSATVQGYVYAIKQLVKTSNNIDDMSSTTNIWFWISGLGSLNLELAQLLARWSLVAAIEAKKEPPAPEIEGGSKLAQHSAQLAAINQRVARIAGLMGPISDLISWANIIKGGDAEHQLRGTQLLFVKWGALRIFYEEALKANDPKSHPETFGPQAKIKESELHDLLKAIVSTSQTALLRSLQRQSPSTAGAATADPHVVGSKRDNRATQASVTTSGGKKDKELPTSQPRLFHTTQTQLEELKALMASSPNIKALRFQMCPGSGKNKVCPTVGGPDKCQYWHHCYLCARNGQKAEECFNHPVGQDCNYYTPPEKRPKGK